jgi:hypothetical protein
MTPASLKVQAYRRTFKGFITLVYSNQKMTSKKYGRPPPAYTKQELKDWIKVQPNFQSLWDTWVASDYDRQLSPSVDRKDNTKGYYLGNIQLVTAYENLINQKKQNISGEYIHVTSKGVDQYDLDGIFIQSHASLSIALRSVGGKSVSNISSVANGKWSTAYGYKWEWPAS